MSKLFPLSENSANFVTNEAHDFSIAGDTCPIVICQVNKIAIIICTLRKLVELKLFEMIFLCLFHWSPLLANRPPALIDVLR